MASNSFGNVFKITTWGESHGKAIGVIIDGCPAGLSLSEEDISAELALRSPGQNPYVSQRKENDRVEILSGLFEGQTTGTPISLVIWNTDVKSEHYESTKHQLRPGHANYTYLEKYGVFDYRGGGRASARETACRVAAGAIAKKLLSDHGISFTTFLRSAGLIEGDFELSDVIGSDKKDTKKIFQSPVYCPCAKTSLAIMEELEKLRVEGDSTGGVVEAIAWGLPVGWGDPVYEKMEANLAKAMLSIPASKGFEIGSGFQASSMNGSVHNDPYYFDGKGIKMATNFAGGTLGGITTGMPLTIKVAFKPPSGIKKVQQTVDNSGNIQTFQIPEGSRHDPCVAIRAVPVVEAMFALVLVDSMLMNRYSRREINIPP